MDLFQGVTSLYYQSFPTHLPNEYYFVLVIIDYSFEIYREIIYFNL